MINYKKDLNKIIQKHNLCISKNPNGTDRSWPKSYIKLFYNDFFNKIFIKNKSPKILEVNQKNLINIKLWDLFFEKAIIDNHELNFLKYQKNDYLKKYDLIIITNPKIIYEYKLLTLISSFIKDDGIIIIENVRREIKLIFKIYKKFFIKYFIDLKDYRLDSFILKNCLLTLKKSNSEFNIYYRLKSIFSFIKFFIMETLLNIFISLKNIH